MTDSAPKELAGYRWAALSAEHVDSVQVMYEANAAALGSELPPTERLQGILHMLGDRAASNSVLAFTNKNEVAALGLLLPQPGNEQHQAHVDLTIHSRHHIGALGQHMLDWLEVQAIQQLRPTGDDTPILMRAACPDFHTQLAELFKMQSFDVFVTQIRMQRDLSLLIEDIALPEGIRLIPYSDGRDEAMRLAFNAAFEGHWIGELNQIGWQERFTDTEKFAPELTKIALDGEQVAGFYLSENQPDAPDEAWLEVLGVIPQWRGKKLGAALTSHALRSYKTAGFTHAGLDVDLENITDAMRLYEKLGFEKRMGTIIFVKQL